MTTELWQSVPGFEELYDVSSLGRVRPVRPRFRSKPFKATPMWGRYVVVALGRHPNATVFPVHRLVAQAFLGPCPEGLVINHIDGNRHNNTADNLEYVTVGENNRHAVATGLNDIRGEGHPNAKLTDSEVHEIRRRYRPHRITMPMLATAYGVARCTIEDIVRGRRWKHLSERGVNYLRILTIVGGSYWEGRKIDPGWSDYFDQLDRLFADARARNMRLNVVIFGDVRDFVPEQQQRIDWLHQMGGYLERHRASIQFVEIANESTGIDLPDGDLAELTQIWRDISTIPVAASAVYDDPSRHPLTGIETFFEDYPSTSVDLLTPHFDRDLRDEGYRPTGQPWHAQFWEFVPTHRFVNDEPIGCGSSVESQCDPGRIVADFINTFAGRGAGYTWHTTAGVRGDSNYWELENAEAQLLAIRNMMRLLPGNIANGRNCNHHWDCHPYESLDQIWPDTGGSGVVRAFAIESDGQWYVMVVGMRGSYEIAAKWPMGVEVFDAVSGARVDVVELAAGQRWTFQQAGDRRDYVHRITPR